MSTPLCDLCRRDPAVRLIIAGHASATAPPERWLECQFCRGDVCTDEAGREQVTYTIGGEDGTVALVFADERHRRELETAGRCTLCGTVQVEVPAS